jgi:hypothetical protein
MTDLTEFLLARIAEDEAAVEQRMADSRGSAVGGDPTVERWPIYRRARAECEAKRRIIGKAQPWIAADDGRAHQTSLRLAGEDILAALASPYADHPDYREEWRP